jgi:deazaflavin-dependent oxidoreductase (nitroreductase family)
MGLLERLDYQVRPAGFVQRGLQNAASRRWAGPFLSRTLHPLDRATFRATGGRHTVAGILAGLPVIMLTTIGARTGEQRTMPLLGIPIGGDMAVIGSNFGTQPTPGWVYNLEADPRGTVAYRDRTVAVTARRADPAEIEHAFDLAAAAYGGFAAYRERAAHRDIRVFILKAKAATPR